MSTSTSNGPYSHAGAGHQVTTPTFPPNLPPGFIDYSQYLNTTPREASGSGTGTPIEYKMGETTAIPNSGMGKEKEKESEKRDKDRDDGSDSEDMDK